VVLPDAVLFVDVLTVTRTVLSPEVLYVWLVVPVDVVCVAPSPNVHAKLAGVTPGGVTVAVKLTVSPVGVAEMATMIGCTTMTVDADAVAPDVSVAVTVGV
jgi:hypothetical protein